MWWITKKKKGDALPVAQESDPIIVTVRNDARAQFLEELTRTLKTCQIGPHQVFVSLYGKKIQTAFSIQNDEPTLTSLRGVEGIESISY